MASHSDFDNYLHQNNFFAHLEKQHGANSKKKNKTVSDNKVKQVFQVDP